MRHSNGCHAVSRRNEDDHKKTLTKDLDLMVLTWEEAAELATDRD